MRPSALIMAVLVFALLIGASAPGRQAKKSDKLKIASSASLLRGADADKVETAKAALRSLVRQEVNYDSEIFIEPDIARIAELVDKKEFDLGAFQGYEFAWMREKHPKLRPLAIAINDQRQLFAHVMVRQDSPAADFAGLKGQPVSIPDLSQGHCRLFIERQCLAAGLPPEKFFSKIVSPDNVEDALDDVVEGVVAATAVDKLAFDAYKRRKPGRFARLKELVRSPPFPPNVVVYLPGHLTETTLKEFKDGMINANQKAEGRRVLELWKHTAFEDVPQDYEKQLEAVRKAFPPLEKK